MKNTLASLLVLITISNLLHVTLSFTARPLAGSAIRPAITAPITPRHPTQLPSRNKTSGDASIPTEAEEEEEELSETKKLLQKVKQAGTAGVISYALWELAFWGVSVPVCIVGYQEVTGHWPDLSNSDDLEKLGAEAFAFVNFARLAVPLRIGLALSTTSWIDENVVQKFMKKDDGQGESDE
mmetsp:Transcript_28525/g.51544  ORF Transcript_28525/g.51544 Transcript_28525/m.51544 type:complete len:182 (-) Transcript_28525:296-841(-)